MSTFLDTATNCLAKAIDTANTLERLGNPEGSARIRIEIAKAAGICSAAKEAGHAFRAIGEAASGIQSIIASIANDLSGQDRSSR